MQNKPHCRNKFFFLGNKSFFFAVQVKQVNSLFGLQCRCYFLNGKLIHRWLFTLVTTKLVKTRNKFLTLNFCIYSRKRRNVFASSVFWCHHFTCRIHVIWKPTLTIVVVGNANFKIKTPFTRFLFLSEFQNLPNNFYVRKLKPRI